MTYRIGLDFGSSTTKIAYLDDQDRLHLFRYPGPTGSVAISTVLACSAQAGQLCAAALEDRIPEFTGQHRNHFVCEHFKTAIAQAESAHWRACEWSIPLSPTDVTRAYLHQLLWENPYSFTHEVGPIGGGVLAVPESWQAPRHAGRTLLQHMFHHDFSLSDVRVHSDAVCAAIYITHCYQQTTGHDLAGNLLVCDMGGSSFFAAVCRVHDQHVDVLDHEGHDKSGLGLAGIAFDRQVITTAYTAAQGTPPAADGKDFHTAVRAFATLKRQEHENVQRLWALQRTVPELSDTPVYVMPDKYTVDANQLRSSFWPIAANLTAVLTRLLARADTHGWSIDHVALVGGFARFPLVQSALRRCLSRLTSAQSNAALYVEGAAPGSEVACGAALLAKHPPRAMEYYPHTIGIFAHRREKGVMVETFLPMIEAGQVPVSQRGPHFVHAGLQGPLTIRIARRGSARLPVYVRWHGTGEPQALPLSEVEYPAPGAYHLGLVLDAQHQALLHFQPVPSGAVQTCQLGQLRFN